MRQLFIMGFAGLVLACLLAWSCPDRAYAKVYTSRYDKDIKSAVSQWWPGIPWQWWKAQLIQESQLDPNAISPVGARGLAQFMPGTWADVTKRLNLGNVSPHVARHSINAGAFYMMTQYNIWSKRKGRPEGDKWKLARACYNAGAGNILKAQKIGGNKVLYEDIIEGLPKVTGHHSKETINYVKYIDMWYNQIVLDRNME